MLNLKQVNALFPIASGLVDGLRVGTSTPNTASIRASMNAFTVLRGTRTVPIKLFHSKPEDLFCSLSDLRRVHVLAATIGDSRRIDPLIVVIDHKGPEEPYILEGAHRLGALHLLGRERFPAMVVIDRG